MIEEGRQSFAFRPANRLRLPEPNADMISSLFNQFHGPNINWRVGQMRSNPQNSLDNNAAIPY